MPERAHLDNRRLLRHVRRADRAARRPRRRAAAAHRPAARPPAGDAPHKACPNCGGDNVADALFCEECGYDFTTGQLPPPEAKVAAPAVVTPGSPPSLVGADWVAEIWIDPDFFVAQHAAGDLPDRRRPDHRAACGTRRR